ncbi:AraC family transcriptional regulator [Halopseudomonas nanhaiensis]|uniref:AraC family transcriptional regulator n=1 Tax=Halopseudomonas nanhaiensis TaxID=2830842 RepID=UPI001CBD594F|nr:AraC family transcriptional regulator [Halopseudomonas nanhaiensis]UAW98731.1 AraC family transcriptional regulator [Halopseudomonas nanhaiensis]
MWRQRRDSTNVLYLLRVAQELDVDGETCLRSTGLRREALDDAEHTHELWQELAVIRNLVAVRPEAGVGLRVGRLYHLTSLGLLGYTMLASRTLSEAIRVSGRFRPLSLSICPVRVEEGPEGLAMLFDDSVLPVDARGLVVERGLAAWTALFGELLQRPFRPRRVEFAGDSADAALYREHFDCDVIIAAGRNGMLISHEDLQAPLPLANPFTQKTCASLCQKLCDSLDDVSGSLARQVLQVLMSHSGRINPARDVAGWLGISERSLHRRLAQEGYSFRILDERVRRQLAEHLLSDSSLGLESIAHQLGYAEAASFSRAFKRWTGLPPLDWRRRRAAGFNPLIDVLTARSGALGHA